MAPEIDRHSFGRWLAARSRVASIAFLALGLGLIAFQLGLVDRVLFPNHPTRTFNNSLLPEAVTCLAIGVFLIFTPKIFRRDERFQPMPVPQLLASLATTRRPFFVCLDCKVILPFEVALGRCPRCESASSCLEVADAHGEKMVRSSLAP